MSLGTIQPSVILQLFCNSEVRIRIAHVVAQEAGEKRMAGTYDLEEILAKLLVPDNATIQQVSRDPCASTTMNLT